ncbi:MAG: glycoside hydrolase, partial [Phycisphaerae bacterium]|nr:glycoside hydrolase [Phycisphaerae bacterium]
MHLTPHRYALVLGWSIALACTAYATAEGVPSLDAGWTHPPQEARLWAYWWWLNGNVDRAAITRDLEEMKAKGFGGALLCDAGGASQNGNGEVPAGPTFAGDAWRDLYRHCLSEAHRLGLEVSLNILSGWNVGGPMVQPADAVKKLVWSEAVVQGPGKVHVELPVPQAREGFYQDAFVAAYPLSPDLDPNRPKLKDWRVKALHEAIQFTGRNAWFLTNSAPDTSLLVAPEQSVPGEEDTQASQVLDLSDRLGPDGILTWDAPAGRWQVLRFGCTLADKCRVSTHSQGWGGHALDVLDEGAFRRYWDAVVEPLIADAGPLAGKTLRYLHTDSWEIGVFNWTPALLREFRQRRGYDPLPWLPVLAGRIVDNRDLSNRFLHDYRKTLGDLAADRHYRPFSEWAARHGLGIHPESGGPHFTPIDAQRCLGMNTIPMSEFWANSATHRVDDVVRFFVKQPASAAHVYGRRIVAAEGPTTVGPHWQETLWDNLKPSFDYACCEGLNRLVWHAFVCSPQSMGIPGQQYFAGTHLNPLVTWWSRSEPFFAYINRCQWMLQQGLFVADVCYYYGDHVPNYTQLRASDPARIGPGYDYDVITEDALLNRLSCKDGQLVLPDGMGYRILVLAPHPAVSLPVLRKVAELVKAGATVLGTRPVEASGLTGYPGSDTEVQRLTEALWTDAGILDRPALAVLQDRGIAPDFEYAGVAGPQTFIRALHRRDGDTDIYFV